MAEEKKVVVIVSREGLGEVSAEDAEFGREMLERYLHALEGRPDRPVAICLYTDGVKLARRGSPLVPALQLLEGLGVRIVACRTCLEHYGTLEDLAVGEVGTMAEIVGLTLEADSVITV